MSTSYRFYFLDGDGKIAAAPECVEANSDEEAIELVREKRAERASELWDESRLVARIEAKRHRA
ncbi:MAG: hypothetical protein ACR2JJ_12050 [Sphingomicrobium sp.]